MHRHSPLVSQEVIRELSLEACADSLIGTELVRGISGGWVAKTETYIYIHTHIHINRLNTCMRLVS